MDITPKVNSYVGSRIRERRSFCGLTQEALATKIGISYQQLQKYETGNNRISAGRLYEVSQLLSVDVSYFFEGLDADAEPKKAQHGSINRPTIRLVTDFAEIDNPEIKASVSNLIRALSRKEEIPDE